MLTDAQIDRYSRQILVPEVGGRGQSRLLAACVAVAGRGPVVAAAALLLGRAGVGTLVVPSGVPVGDLGPDCRLARDGAGRPADLHLAVVADAAHALALELPAGVPTAIALTAPAPVVVARAGPPCLPCALAGVPVAAPASASSLALGAVLAAEALRLLLGAATDGRRTWLGGPGRWLEAQPLEAVDGCAACGTAS